MAQTTPVDGGRGWRSLRPVVGIAAAASIGYQLGGGGLITLFPGFGVLGLGRALRHPGLKRAILLSFLWSATTLLSAEVHGDKLVTQMGLYGIVVGLSVAGMWWLHEVVKLHPGTIVMVVGAGWFALNRHALTTAGITNEWKYGLGVPTAMLVLGLGWRVRAPRLLLIAALVVLGVVSFHQDARYLTGMSAAIVLATLLHKHGRVTRAAAVRQLVIFCIAILAVITAYPKFAEHGYFGERARVQQAQISSEGLNFLFANRPELVQSAWIAAHHPILGIGPGSTLSSQESNASIGYLVHLGLPMNVNRIKYMVGDSESQNFAQKGYATHSSGIDSVRHGGILAALFWLFLAYTLIRTILRRAEQYVWELPAVLWISLMSLWDMLFSPLTGTQWPEIALALFVTVGIGTRGRGGDPAEQTEQDAPEDTPTALAATR